jgi:hypothetical protein
MLYDINFWKKKLQSCELTSSLMDGLKSWNYNDVDDENNNMVRVAISVEKIIDLITCQIKNKSNCANVVFFIVVVDF